MINLNGKPQQAPTNVSTVNAPSTNGGSLNNYKARGDDKFYQTSPQDLYSNSQLGAMFTGLMNGIMGGTKGGGQSGNPGNPGGNPGSNPGRPQTPNNPQRSVPNYGPDTKWFTADNGKVYPIVNSDNAGLNGLSIANADGDIMNLKGLEGSGGSGGDDSFIPGRYGGYGANTPVSGGNVMSAGENAAYNRIRSLEESQRGQQAPSQATSTRPAGSSMVSLMQPQQQPQQQQTRQPQTQQQTRQPQAPRQGLMQSGGLTKTPDSGLMQGGFQGFQGYGGFNGYQPLDMSGKGAQAYNKSMMEMLK